MTKDIKICKCLAIICLVIRLLLNDTTKCHNIILDIDKLVRAMTFELDLTDIVPQRPCRLTTLLTLTLSSTMSIILIKWIRLANSEVSDILLLWTVVILSMFPGTVLLLPATQPWTGLVHTTCHVTCCHITHAWCKYQIIRGTCYFLKHQKQHFHK